MPTPNDVARHHADDLAIWAWRLRLICWRDQERAGHAHGAHNYARWCKRHADDCERRMNTLLDLRVVLGPMKETT